MESQSESQAIQKMSSENQQKETNSLDLRSSSAPENDSPHDSNDIKLRITENYNKPENKSTELHNSSSTSPNHDGQYDLPSQESSDAKGNWKADQDDFKVSSQSIDIEENPVLGPPSAKDTGYGWLVVFMVFVLNLITAGYVKSFGITYTLILDYFPDTSGAASGWIMGLLAGCRGLLSPVMGALTVVAGPRKAVIIGTLICVAGLLLAVPAFSVPYLAVTLGGIVGTGMCMAETPGFLVVTDYFEEKRPLANGLRAAGNPMGGIIFAPMVVILQQQFGLRGAFIIIAGLMLQLVVVGMFMRPFEQHRKLVEAKYWRKALQENRASDHHIRWLKETQARNQSRKKKPLDFTLLKNPAYLVYLFMVMCTSAALPSGLLFAPAYGRSIGLSDLQNSAIASYTSCCDFTMRLICGWIFNRENVNTRYGFISGLVVGGVGCLIVPLCTQMWHLFIFSTMFSVCMAFYFTLINTILADQFGGDAMASTWGFLRMLQGACNFLYPSLLGLVMDASGGMAMPYIMMGSLALLGAFIFSLQPIIAKLPGSKVNMSY